ncbi:MAG: DUF1343 domain-containing protein [Candidatus Symbiothrix sp.]|jgi:uncharacterized protein YbbC (DUF1343 family)|nr:DUF1343 domain-containing protein [Candidatus Symbiothrix sp.]
MKHCLQIVLFLCLCSPLAAQIKTGAELTEEYFPMLRDRQIGVFTNHTGRIGATHLVDSLMRAGFRIVSVFAPEHGFRGDADAGEKIEDGCDSLTGIPVISLYKYKTGKPTPAQLAKIDLLLVDIQDVGLRFYTYYITLFHLMDACAEQGKPVLLLDRPNPNGFYVDGPILDMKYKSGVGWLPIPVVHGMTLGELAQMINGEQWLPQQRKCRLTVIPCRNYTHQSLYDLPLPPSPNLPNMKSVYLYPSLCLMEGTVLSVGRGTDFPFQVYGHPEMQNCIFYFQPSTRAGAKNPLYADRTCWGVDLRRYPDDYIRQHGLDLHYLIDAYRRMNIGKAFFKPFFRNLIGVDYVQTMIEEGKSAQEIKQQWQADVALFIEQRRPYLLYAE